MVAVIMWCLLGCVVWFVYADSADRDDLENRPVRGAR